MSGRVGLRPNPPCGEIDYSIADVALFASSRNLYVTSTGGVKPVSRKRSERCVSKLEREEIPGALVRGDSCRAIAAAIGLSHSTVSREFDRNDGREGYRAHDAVVAAWGRQGATQATPRRRGHTLRLVC
jgi:hypothetical protein